MWALTGVSNTVLDTRSTAENTITRAPASRRLTVSWRMQTVTEEPCPPCRRGAQSEQQTGERPRALGANKWGFGLIRKALDVPEVVTTQLRSESTGGGMERVFEGVGTAGLKALYLEGTRSTRKNGHVQRDREREAQARLKAQIISLYDHALRFFLLNFGGIESH